MAPKRAAALKKTTYNDSEDRDSATPCPSLTPPASDDDAFEDVIDEDVKPTLPKKRSSPNKTSTTPKKKARGDTTSPTAVNSPKAVDESGEIDWKKVEGFAGDKRAALVMVLFDEGAKSIGRAALAERFGLSYRTLVDAVRPGRGGNLLDKSIKAVKQ